MIRVVLSNPSHPEYGVVTIPLPISRAQYDDAVRELEELEIGAVGIDENGLPRHAHKRSTNTEGQSFRQTVEGSDFHYTFNWCGKSDELYVFEAPIDMLSYITMHPENWQRHSYVACCGTSSIPALKMLERVPSIQGVGLCHDNDKTGESAAHRLEELLEAKGVASGRMKSANKDWNEDLVAAVYPTAATTAMDEMSL